MAQHAGSFADLGPIAVLGATGGMGSAVARRIAALGGRTVLLARDGAKLAALGAELGAPTVELTGAAPGTVAQALGAATAAHGPLGGIVNCIGSLLLKPANRTTVDEWNAVLEANLGSAFGVAMALPTALPQGGSIVFVSSVAATTGMPNHEAIAAAKAGVEGLCRSIAAGQVRRGIRCNCVAPALVRTPMTEPMLARAGMEDAVRKQNPMQHVGTVEDLASAICWLLDPAQRWVTGQVLGIDGGLGVLRTPTA